MSVKIRKIGLPLRYLNAWRNVVGRFDLLCFLFKWDSDYRKDLVITVLAFCLAGYSIYDMDDWMDMIALAIEMAIIFIQLGTELSILPRDYRPSYSGVRYSAQTSTHISYDELSFLMSGVYPAVREERLGFTFPRDVIGMTRESALVSDLIDDAVMTRPRMPYAVSVRPIRFIRSRHQIRYIAIRVADKVQHTTNGSKLALDAQADALLSDTPVPLRKSYYFDALLTAEAFRSRIFRNNISGEKEVYTDLTTYFPVYKETIDGQEAVRFTDDFYQKTSGHIGITSLLLTENNRVAMMHQGVTKAIGARMVGLGGSGSLDYGDMPETKGVPDLRDLVVHGMAREVAEETGLTKYFDVIRDNTIVTGFFRWVDRSGKPEFVGLTRAGGVPYSASGAIDGDEVVHFSEIPIDIRDVPDFIKVMDYVRRENLRLPLSSLMALRRLVVIAGYGDAATPEQRAIRDRVSAFIRGE